MDSEQAGLSLPEWSNEERRTHVSNLCNRILSGRSGATHSLIATIALNFAHSNSELMFTNHRGPRNDDDARLIYNISHETIHIAQLVTSTWVHRWLSFMAGMALEVARALKNNAIDDNFKRLYGNGYEDLYSRLYAKDERFSPFEIMESQAVMEGTWGALPRPGFKRTVEVARRFHKDSPDYTGIMNELMELFGEQIAVTLGSRLCAIALHDKHPGQRLTAILSQIEKFTKRHLRDLCEATPSEFLVACGLSPVEECSFILRAREQNPNRLAYFWSHRLLGSYFESIQNLTLEQLLWAWLHPGQVQKYSPAGTGTPFLFHPLATVYIDGHATSAALNSKDLDYLVDIGLSMLDGLDWLEANVHKPFVKEGFA